MNVLILMSDGVAATRLAETVGLRGHQIKLASDIEAAVSAYQAGAYPLVLVDATCSLFDSRQLCQRLRASTDSNELQLIAITENHDAGHVSELLEAGFDDLLADPSHAPEAFRARLQVAEHRAAALDLGSTRKLIERELEIDAEIQDALSSISHVSLAVASLEKLFDRTLEILFSVRFVGLQSQGAVYLVKEDEPSMLQIAAQRGLPSELLALCYNVPFGCCLCGRAAATHETIFADCVGHQHERRYPGMAPHGHYCVPIKSGNDLYGIINLYVPEAHKKHEREGVFLSAVADMLANTIKRRRAEQALATTEVELLAAERMQQQLLPHAAPRILGLDIHGALIPAEFTAGDYFDYLTLPDGSLGIVVADVTGHGFSSALIAASAQARLKSLAETHAEIDVVMNRANQILSANESGFVTAILARLAPETRTLWYVNAGHPTGYVIGDDGSVRTQLRSGSPPLGVVFEAEFPSSGAIQLKTGDLVALFTDGILEESSPSGELFGTERTIAMLMAARHQSARAIVESLFAAVCDFSGREHPRDDVTAVVLKVES